MSYDKKLPSICARLSVNNFNKLIQLLTDVENIDIKEVREKGLEIKERLLKYSVPSGDEIDSRFYHSQIKAILYILLTNIRDVNISDNYYEMLLNNRKKYEEKKEENV